MAENKKSILLYVELIHTFDELTDAQAGKLVKHLFRYVNDLNPEYPDKITKLLFQPIMLQLKRDLVKWEDTKISRSENGSMGNLKRWNKDLYQLVSENKLPLSEALKIAKNRKTSLGDTLLSPTIANVADNVNVNVINKKSIKRKTVPVFTPPNLDEVKEYFLAKGYSAAAAEKAFNYYDSANWVDGQGNKVRNWKQKMQGVWFKEENKISLRVVNNENFFGV